MSIAMKKNIGSIAVVSLLGVSAAAFHFYGESTSTNLKPIEKTEVALPSSSHDLHAILAIKDESEKTRLLNLFFAERMKDGALNTLALIAGLHNLSDRQLSYELALAQWSIENRIALLQWLERQPSSADLDPALQNLLATSLELKDSLLFAEKISVSATRKEELTRIFKQWTPIDPELIINWSLKERADNDVWLALAFQVLSEESHLAAIQGLSYLTAASLSQVRVALQAMIDNYQPGSIDSDTLVALQSIEPYIIREEAISALLPLIGAEKHVNLAMISALLDSLAPGELRDELFELLASSWVEKNPSEAGEFAQSLTGDLRARAMTSVATSWAEKDLAAADRWLKTMHGNLDLPSSGIARVAARKGNIQISDEWIDDIFDEEIRDAAIGEVLQTYYRSAPEVGIYHLVYQKNLTVEKKLALLAEIYPDEYFVSPNQALDEIRRLEGPKRPHS